MLMDIIKETEEEEVYSYKASYDVHVHLLQRLGSHCVHSLHCVVLFDYIVSIIALSRHNR